MVDVGSNPANFIDILGLGSGPGQYIEGARGEMVWVTGYVGKTFDVTPSQILEKDTWVYRQVVTFIKPKKIVKNVAKGKLTLYPSDGQTLYNLMK